MKTEDKFWFKWMLNYSFGELIGIGIAATIGRFLFIGFSSKVSSSGGTSFLTLIILLIAGIVEGFITGYIQWKSLSKVVLHIKAKTWIITTTIATIISWLLILPPSVMFISILSKISAINTYYSVLYIGLAGIAFGGLIGIMQFFIIKKHYNRPLVWIFANVVGWIISFLIVYKSLLLFKDSTSFVYNLMLIIGSCILSGLLQGIVAGTALHFLMSVRKGDEIKIDVNLQ